MLFSEIYGSYFNVVAAVLSEAVKGTLTGRRMTELVEEKAFAESSLSIPASVKGTWPLVKNDFSTVIKHEPTMPLTLLQKRWLKALLQDPRIALFAPDTAGLEDVEPLYRQDTFVFFDRYADGDPYQDETYIRCFRALLQAIHEKRFVRLYYDGRSGKRHTCACIPYRLEYSAKDDKFRLLSVEQGRRHTINLARVRRCELLHENERKLRVVKEKQCEVTLLLKNERNALERVLLHFSHFDKETLRLEGERYQLKLGYDRDDETELLIRILSFGPMLEVVAPAEFRQLVKERIVRQMGR